MYDANKIIRGLERCRKCGTSPIASEEERKAYFDCEYTVGLYCGKDRLLFETIDLLKKYESRLKTDQYLFDFIGTGFTEWANLIADGKAEVVCETDNDERKTVITFRMIEKKVTGDA